MASFYRSVIVGVAAAALSSGALSSHVMAATPVETHGALSVKGNRIVDKDARPVALAGVSFFWSNTGWGQDRFYNAGAVKSFARDWNASVVRAAMGAEGNGGFGSDPKGNQARVEAVVDAAVEAGVYVIIDWHSHTAEKNPQAAVAFFSEMARKYGHLPNVIYEIYNEPLQVSWSGVVKPYSETVVAAIRAIDPDNLIIVGTPTWSQDVDAAAADPLKGENLTYTLHFYSGSHKEGLRDKARVALKSGASLFVSEWGTVNANGDGGVATEEVARWSEFMRENCLSHAAWAVSDKREGASYFKPGASSTGPWTDEDLTPSGIVVRDMVKGWKTVCE